MAVFKVRRFEVVDGRRDFDDGPAYTVMTPHVRFAQEAFPPEDATGGWLITPVPVMDLEEAVQDWQRRTGAYIQAGMVPTGG